ncbi:MAG: hypothetical protein U1E28_04620 [Beijerinckiaceae bacterium]
MVEAAAETPAPAQPAPGRSCGTCTLCCKVYDVPEAGTVSGQWCTHCAPGQGCRIWDTRPEQCRAFNCLWLTQEWLGPEWKPETARMVFTMDPNTRFLMFQVDPGAPTAWKREPYYTHIRNWAAGAARENRHVLVLVNKHATLVLPTGEFDLGVMGPQDKFFVDRTQDGGYQVRVARA